MYSLFIRTMQWKGPKGPKAFNQIEQGIRHFIRAYICHKPILNNEGLPTHVFCLVWTCAMERAKALRVDQIDKEGPINRL